MMAMAIRIGVLSAVMAVYMSVAFRGIEYDFMETGPALLGFFITFTILTVIAALIYKVKNQPDSDTLSAFSFRVWLITAPLVTIGWLVFYAQDVAAAGEFRDNIILGGVIMAVMVGVLNFVLAYAISYGIEYFKPKRRRT